MLPTCAGWADASTPAYSQRSWYLRKKLCTPQTRLQHRTVRAWPVSRQLRVHLDDHRRYCRTAYETSRCNRTADAAADDSAYSGNFHDGSMGPEQQQQQAPLLSSQLSSAEDGLDLVSTVAGDIASRSETSSTEQEQQQSVRYALAEPPLGTHDQSSTSWGGEKQQQQQQQQEDHDHEALAAADFLSPPQTAAADVIEHMRALLPGSAHILDNLLQQTCSCNAGSSGTGQSQPQVYLVLLPQLLAEVRAPMFIAAVAAILGIEVVDAAVQSALLAAAADQLHHDMAEQEGGWACQWEEAETAAAVQKEEPAAAAAESEGEYHDSGAGAFDVNDSSSSSSMTVRNSWSTYTAADLPGMMPWDDEETTKATTAEAEAAATTHISKDHHSMCKDGSKHGRDILQQQQQQEEEIVQDEAQESAAVVQPSLLLLCSTETATAAAVAALHMNWMSSEVKIVLLPSHMVAAAVAANQTVTIVLEAEQSAAQLAVNQQQQLEQLQVQLKRQEYLMVGSVEWHQKSEQQWQQVHRQQDSKRRQISKALQRTSSISLHSLEPSWHFLAVLDALALPWGLKQLSMAYMACHMMGLSPPGEYYVLNWAIAVLCNLYDQYQGQGSVADMINVPIRMTLLKRYKGAVQAHLVFALGLVAATLVLLPGSVFQSFIPGTLATSAYWLPILPGGKTAKQLPAGKNLFAAGVETFALVSFALAAVPASEAAAVSSAVLAATSVFFVAINMALAVLADIRDLAGDKAEGTQSIPVVFGVQAAVTVAESCCVVACCAAAVSVQNKWPAAASVVGLILAAINMGLGDSVSSSSGKGIAGTSSRDSMELIPNISWFHALVGCVGCLALNCC